MSFRLVDTGWNAVLIDAMRTDHSVVRLVCPFIKKGAVERLFANSNPGTLQVITRFNLDEFAQGISDLSALRFLLDRGASIRGVKNLHAKLYLFGDSRAIVTSANLTEAALLRNHEFGFVAEDVEIVGGCRKYFDDLWGKAGSNLTAAMLANWEQSVTNYLVSGGRLAAVAGLGDEGVDVGLPAEPIAMPILVDEAPQAFVKFFGKSDNRADRSLPILEQVRGSGCHWACTYPKARRPRQVQDGAILFMGWMVKDPDDILIFGREGEKHRPAPCLQATSRRRTDSTGQYLAK